MPVFRFPKCPLKFLKLWNMTCGDTRIFCPVLLECRKALREKICSVCGRHLMSINFLPRNQEGYHYAYSLRMGEKLCLLVGVRTLPLLRSRHKKPPHHAYL